MRMSMDEHQVVFKADSWMVVESRAEELGQQAHEYVSETIALGLMLANTYWEHKALGHDTHLMFEKGPGADSYSRFNVDFKDVDSVLGQPEVNGLPADPFALELVGVEIDTVQQEAIAHNVQLLGVANRALAAWFFNVRYMIDVSFAEGSKVFMNHQDNGYIKLEFIDENQASS